MALRLREDAGNASVVKWRRGESRKVAVHGEGPAAMVAVGARSRGGVKEAMAEAADLGVRWSRARRVRDARGTGRRRPKAVGARA